MTFEDTRTGQQFPQHFCPACFDEILLSYPEVSKELKDAGTALAQISRLTSIVPEATR